MAVLRRYLPTAVAISVGVFVLLRVFLPIGLLDAMGVYFINMAVLIAAIALFLGLINVLRVHSRRILDRQPQWFFSFVLMASMLIVLAIGLPVLPGQPAGPAQPAVRWIFDNIQAPLQASLSALLVFLVVTAALRLSRLRNLESAVMLLVVLLVLAGQVALGLVPLLGDIKDWILDVPVMAGVRGILLGVALGAILTGIRLFLGVERPYGD